jgi:hypothetical protein
MTKAAVFNVEGSSFSGNSEGFLSLWQLIRLLVNQLFCYALQESFKTLHFCIRWRRQYKTYNQFSGYCAEEREGGKEREGGVSREGCIERSEGDERVWGLG